MNLKIWLVKRWRLLGKDFARLMKNVRFKLNGLPWCLMKNISSSLYWNSCWNYFIIYLLRNMTRASWWEFEDINEQSFVGITGVVSQHSVVNKFLGALALVAWSQQPACRVWSQACFHASSLRVIMNSIDNNSPVTIDITSSFWHGIFYIGWTQVSFWTNPMRSIIRGWSFGSTGVVLVIKMIFLFHINMFHQIIGTLVCDVWILFVEKIVLWNS